MPDSDSAARRARAEFTARFEDSPTLTIRSPGRVNLIGDHTDYSDGFVLPIAIDRSVGLALRPSGNRTVRAWAELTNGWTEFDASRPVSRSGWQAYVHGVAAVLSEGPIPLSGFDAVITSDLPAGAGLSSSAALELGAARAFAEVSGIAWDPVAMAVACQRAENEWVGMNCGIMDQLVCATGVAGSAMLIDCRALTVEPMPLPPPASIVVLDTTTRRELVGTAYNERRAACETAAAACGVAALRDLDLQRLEESRALLNPVVFRRARHVVNENAATLAAATALAAGDLTTAGALMNDSHASLRDDYEVTTPALDAMAEAARCAPGAYGARMTGAGFGGSVVALVATDSVDAFEVAALSAYEDATGVRGHALRVAASRGTSVSS